jgi:hypothetical protein
MNREYVPDTFKFRAGVAVDRLASSRSAANAMLWLTLCHILFQYRVKWPFPTKSVVE